MQDQSPPSGEMHDDPHLIRLGYFNHANLLPLLYPIEAGWAAPESPWKLAVVNAAPSELLESISAGRLDAAFLGPSAVSKNDQVLTTLSGWGLACQARVETALLLTPDRIDLIDESNISVSPEAVASTAHDLLRMLIKPYYGIGASLLLPGDSGYDPEGARLLYGDEAARQAGKKSGAWVAEDMGVAWWVFSGLPTVWEILALRRNLDTHKSGATDQINSLLKLSERMGQEQRATVLQVASERLGLKQDQVKDLFSRQSYKLGNQEQKSLARFLELSLG